MDDPSLPPHGTFPTAPPEVWPGAAAPPAGFAPAPPPGPPPGSSPKPRGGSPWPVLALAVAFAVFVIYGLGWALERENDRIQRRAGEAGPVLDEPTETDPSTSEPVPPGVSLDVALPDLIAFVQEERANTFATPPDVEVLADPDFAARAREWLDAEAGLSDSVAARLAAFGALRSRDWIEPFTAAYIDTAIAAYDPRTSTLIVRSGPAANLTGPDRSEIVGLLARGLELGRLDLDQEPAGSMISLVTEADFAVRALVEGAVAHTVAAYERTFFDQADVAESQARHDQHAAQVSATGAEPLITTNLLPRVVGAPLAARLLDGPGGNSALDRATARPQASSASLILGRLADSDEPVEVPQPRADGTVESRGVLGAADLAMLVSAGASSASDALVGSWGGGSFVQWSDGSQPCVRFRVVGRNAASTASLAEVLGPWAERVAADLETVTDPRVATSDHEVVQVSACG